MRDRVQGWMVRFHSQERAAVMTEFIITLPIFIIIFSGTLKFYGLNQAGVQVKTEAYKQMMSDSVKSQKEIAPTSLSSAARILPLTGAAQAGTWHATHTGTVADTAFDVIYDVPVGYSKSAGAGLGGHMTDMWIRTRPFASAMGDWDWENGGMGWEKNQLVHNKVQGLWTEEGYDGNGTIYSEWMLDDGLDTKGPSGQSASGLLGFANKALSWAGARPAIAAGMRYGIVGGASEKTYSLPTGNAQLEADYHVAAPPRATSRYISIAVIRTMFAGDSDQSFNSHILKFEMSPQIESQTSSNSYDASQCEGAQSSLEGLNADTNMSQGEAEDMLDNLDNIIGDAAGCSGGASNDGQGTVQGLFEGLPGGSKVPQMP